jgi:predicted DNA-binding transcriptional regulator AlpA
MAMKVNPTPPSTTTEAPSDWLRTAMLAKRLQLNTEVILRMGKRGDLPTPARIGGTYFWHWPSVEAKLHAAAQQEG